MGERRHKSSIGRCNRETGESSISTVTDEAQMGGPGATRKRSGPGEAGPYGGPTNYRGSEGKRARRTAAPTRTEPKSPHATSACGAPVIFPHVVPTD